MAKSKETYNKKEKEKKKQRQKQDKLQRKEERKASKRDGNSLDNMIAFVDENGNLSDSPPDTKKQVSIDHEQIPLSVTGFRQQQEAVSPIGTITFFNEEKGFGFITEKNSKNRFFFHINDAREQPQLGDIVQFDVQASPRGPQAVQLVKIS